MIQKLRKKHLVHQVIWSVLFLLAAIVVLAVEAPSLMLLLSKPMDLYEMRTAEITNGAYVEADIDTVWDCYAYTTNNGKKVEADFLIPTADGELMTLTCRGKNMKIADSNMEIVWDILDNEDSPYTTDDLKTFHVRGTIETVTGSKANMLKNYIREVEAPEGMVLTYVLHVNQFGSFDAGSLVALSGVVLFLLILMVCFLISGFTASNVKNVMKYCDEKGGGEYLLQKINNYYDAEPAVRGVRAGGEFFMAVYGNKLFFAPSEECLWCYQKVTQHRTNGIPTGKTYAVVMNKTDGKSLEIPFGKKQCEEAMEYIAKKMPYLIFGYDDNLKIYYQRQREDLIKTVAERKAQFEETAPFSDSI